MIHHRQGGPWLSGPGQGSQSGLRPAAPTGQAQHAAAEEVAAHTARTQALASWLRFYNTDADTQPLEGTPDQPTVMNAPGWHAKAFRNGGGGPYPDRVVAPRRALHRAVPRGSV
jgi:hypothetical protein